MQVRARLKNFRMSPKKARRVADLVRGEKTAAAKDQLKNYHGKMAMPILKLIDSSIANGAHNFGLDKNNLYIEQIKVDEGTIMKRWKPRAHGRAYPILKRSCHIEIILNEVEEGKGRIKVEKKEAKTMTYKELKKISKEADKIMEKQKEKKKEEKNKAEKKKGTETGPQRGAISKMFRRKSI